MNINEVDFNLSIIQRGKKGLQQNTQFIYETYYIKDEGYESNWLLMIFFIVDSVYTPLFLRKTVIISEIFAILYIFKTWNSINIYTIILKIRIYF